MITRHNYEEYFILYMDNELSSEERRMVEAFVQQHPDLKEELDTLIQYKLAPDSSIVFEGKEELMKENGHSLITQNNYKEWFTLYIDNELGEDQQQQVEQFLAANNAAQKELALLQQTKLQPETIVFAGKDVLYRREEKVRRIPVWAWRAAAAILILAIAIPAAILLNKKPSADSKDGGVAGTTNNKNTDITPAENNTQPPLKNNNSIAVEKNNTPVVVPFTGETKQNINPSEKKKGDNAVAAVSKKEALPENRVSNKTIAPVNKEEQAIAQEKPELKPSNNLPQPLNNPNINSTRKTDDAVAYNKPDENVSGKNLPSTDVTKSPSPPSEYTQAVYKPGNTEELEQPDGKKNKNRGIFRKIARTFQKRTNIDPTDDNRLLVGGLAIKLK